MSVCTEIDDCFREISSYLSHEKTGFPLVVNTENAVQYNAIMNRLLRMPAQQRFLCRITVRRTAYLMYRKRSSP